LVGFAVGVVFTGRILGRNAFIGDQGTIELAHKILFAVGIVFTFIDDFENTFVFRILIDLTLLTGRTVCVLGTARIINAGSQSRESDLLADLVFSTIRILVTEFDARAALTTAALTTLTLRSRSTGVSLALLWIAGPCFGVAVLSHTAMAIYLASTALYLVGTNGLTQIGFTLRIDLTWLAIPLCSRLETNAVFIAAAVTRRAFDIGLTRLPIILQVGAFTVGITVLVGLALLVVFAA